MCVASETKVFFVYSMNEAHDSNCRKVMAFAFVMLSLQFLEHMLNLSGILRMPLDKNETDISETVSQFHSFSGGCWVQQHIGRVLVIVAPDRSDNVLLFRHFK